MIPQAGAHCTHGIPDIAGSNSFHENSIPSIERIRGKQQYCEHQHYGDDVISDLQRVLHLFALALCLHDHHHDVLVCPRTSGMHSRTQSISHVRTFFGVRMSLTQRIPQLFIFFSASFNRKFLNSCQFSCFCSTCMTTSMVSWCNSMHAFSHTVNLICMPFSHHPLPSAAWSALQHALLPAYVFRLLPA